MNWIIELTEISFLYKIIKFVNQALRGYNDLIYLKIFKQGEQ